MRTGFLDLRPPTTVCLPSMGQLRDRVRLSATDLIDSCLNGRGALIDGRCAWAELLRLKADPATL